MNKDYAISITLDKRRQKANGTYPVKLRVFTNIPRKQKLYATKFEYNETDFERIWQTVKTRKELKSHKLKLQALENKANEVADKLTPFTIEEFEKKLFRKKGDDTDIFYHYKNKIKDLKSQKSISTANNYGIAEKSLKAYLKFKTNKEQKKLSFFDVTPKWLTGYQTYMTDKKQRSLTTVSIYLRTLRTLFNEAIQAKDIEQEIYPFGKNKYQVPAVKNVKKALSKKELSTLLNAKPSNKEQEKAKDFWFLSFRCFGMNIKDIAMLKFKDISSDSLTFYRAKTRNTSKGNLKPVEVPLLDETKQIIEKYANEDQNPENYVFSIIETFQNEEVKHKRIKNFTRFINQHIKKLAVSVDLSSDISTYWARHSFATLAINSGASMEFVSEALSHNNMNTTQGYFAGFEDKTKKEITKNILNF